MTTNNFFSNLKCVCRKIEQGIGQLQSEVETKTSSRSSGSAVKKLANLKQEIQDMKADGRQKCQTLTEERKKFEELIACCHSLIDIQSNKLNNIEIFMKQYGYQDFKPKEEIKDEITEEEQCDDDTKENDKPVTPPQSDKPTKVKTPKPEDFGFSSYTLRAMERGFGRMQQEFTSSGVPHSEARIPSVFNQDEFVSLTPSVFGRHVPFHTPGKYTDASPTIQDFITPADKKISRNKNIGGSDFPKFNLAEDSPEPPVFQTPGMKHLGQKETFNNLPESVPAFKNIQRAPMNMMNSPQVPAFQSESVKKLMTKDCVTREAQSSDKSSRTKLYDSLPQTPEFTVNIKELQMSGIIKEPDINKPRPYSKEPTPPTFQYKGMGDTDAPMPKDFQPLTERLGHDITSNITPPMPEMLSDRHSKFNSNKQQIRDLSKTPPTPKFLSKYANDLVHNK